MAVGSALGTALAAVAAFSIICWANLTPSEQLRGPPLLIDRPAESGRRKVGHELGILRFCHNHGKWTEKQKNKFFVKFLEKLVKHFEGGKTKTKNCFEVTKRKQKQEWLRLLFLLGHRFCHYPEWMYAHCERVLDFSFPYLDWPVEQVRAFQLITPIFYVKTGQETWPSQNWPKRCGHRWKNCISGSADEKCSFLAKTHRIFAFSFPLLPTGGSREADCAHGRPLPACRRLGWPLAFVHGRRVLRLRRRSGFRHSRQRPGSEKNRKQFRLPNLHDFLVLMFVPLSPEMKGQFATQFQELLLFF